MLMSQINIQYHKLPCGELLLGSYQGQLCLCDWRYREKRDQLDKRLQQGLNACFVEQDDEVLQETRKQICEYLKGKRTEFDIPLLFVGTEFQKSVWQTLAKVPYGKTVSYLELAQNMNNPKAVRAIASANGANALSIIIPCHRVIGKDGSLVGYAGGLEAKKYLLEIEVHVD